jgi:hypothetical protein
LTEQFFILVANVIDVAGVIDVIAYDGYDGNIFFSPSPVALTLIYRKAIKQWDNDLLNDAIDLTITDPSDQLITKVNGAAKVKLVRGGGLVAHRFMENGKR